MIFLFLSPAGNIPLLLLFSVFYGFTNSGTSICFAMVCDSIEYGDYMYGTRDDALAFSFQSFGVKVANAITGAGGVLLLAAVGYAAGAEQSASTIRGINMIVNLLPALLSYAGLLPMLFYKLDEKTMNHIRTVLEARRAGHMLEEDPMYGKM